MHRFTTPDTARPLHATGPVPPYYDYANTPTPRASDYNHTVVYNPSHTPPRRAHALPSVSPASLSRWTRLRSINNPPQMNQYTEPKFNVNAPEFHPSQPMRPASARSVSSSTSSSASSSASAYSSATSATSWGESSPPPTARPTAARVFSDVSHGEHAYKSYREKLRTDVSRTITDLLNAGVASCENTQNIAMLAARLSAHAPCGPEEFKAHIRTEALIMFTAYWQSDAGPWRAERNPVCEYLTSRGINIAAFMGSLFRYDLLSGRDVHHCLNTLLSGVRNFMKLQAVHALVVHCGMAICGGDIRAATEGFCRRLQARGPDGLFVWGQHDESHALLEDLLDNLDRWFASHEMAQIISNASPRRRAS
ncbi:hypothetical protein B0H13DRAFT_2662352 [Mycena leptocephala]|nr:hypothetical protein B0H13DRAFT_2662352 [Mycena leptocephala]